MKVLKVSRKKYELAFNHYVISLIVFFALALFACENKSKTIRNPQVDAFKQCEHLGRGTNFGNILYRDGHFGVIVYNNDNWNKEKEQKEFEHIKEIGLNHVRICIGPFGYADEKPHYILSKNFFERLDWTIDKALSQGLAVIIDQHEYEAMSDDPIGLKEIFLSTWKQIAEHYKDYPDNVYFGVLNEPHGNLTPYLWNYLCLDAINVIRSSNPNRTLVIGPGTWNNKESLQYLKLPENDRNIIVEFHYYLPFHFTHQGTEWAEGSDEWVGTKWTGSQEEKQAIADDFKIAVDWAKLNKRPLYLGEFGAYYKGDLESRALWLKSVIQLAENNKIAWAMWDMMGPYFGIYDESTESWIEPLKNVIMSLSK
jgi:endoglucanase